MVAQPTPQRTGDTGSRRSRERCSKKQPPRIKDFLVKCLQINKILVKIDSIKRTYVRGKGVI